MAGEVKLTVVEGHMQGRVFRFREHDTFIFGRAQDCHMALPQGDKTASRHHFLMEVSPPRVCVRDLGSLNGTHVNGVKHGGRQRGQSPEQGAQLQIPQVELKDGDRVRVGKTIFALAVEVPPECAGCGVEIPEQFVAFCKTPAGVLMCAECQQASAAQHAAPAPPAVVRCKRCRNEAPPSLGVAPGSDYTCASCRTVVEADPVSAVLEDMLQQARANAQAPVSGITRYEIGPVLGAGGMGSVYRARRRSDGREVALKVMLPKVATNPRTRKMFLREIEVMQTLRHPNIVELLDSGEASGAFFLAMELCQGGSVAGWMDRVGALTPRVVLRIGVEVLEGLEYAHGRGFIHRDIKPENIMLDAPQGAAKLGDFGLAKNYQQAGLSGMSVTGKAMGTFPFMPREQLINFKYTKPTSDLWSTAATLYHMLTCAYPRDSGPHDDPLMVVLTKPAVPILQRAPRIPKPFADVLDRALLSDPAQRYASAADFRRALLAIAP